ncbi:hypothetical protein ACFYT3_22380 [Nocardia amikacinitolerans]|uniref:hypothetical protein n=1 Tax=Nocardia amikacinitolerans TaxID=756689 RepID=UPI0036C9BB53
MNLQPQVLVDTLVRQHGTVLARLHADLHEAVLESATRWADRFSDPADMSGHTRCITVRQTLLHMNSSRPRVSGQSMTMSESVGLSVVLRDGAGHRVRVRKYPSDHLGERIRTVQTPPPGQRAAAAVAAQMALDEGMSEPMFDLNPAELPYELFVLWWLDSEQIGLAGAELAAVFAIDDAKLVRILATAPLPAPAPFVAAAEPEVADQSLFDDFGEFDADGEETGNDPA